MCRPPYMLLNQTVSTGNDRLSAALSATNYAAALYPECSPRVPFPSSGTGADARICRKSHSTAAILR
jgi:hypothetical protein